MSVGFTDKTLADARFLKQTLPVHETLGLTKESYEHLRNEYFSLIKDLANDPEKAPKQLDAVYLPGLSKGMVENCRLFDYVASLVKSGRVKKVFYNGSDGHGASDSTPGSAWPGADWYKKELVTRGVPARMLVPTGTEGIHTRAETDELAATMKREKAESVIVATVPYHNVRSLSCLVGSMAKHGCFFKAYYAQQEPTDWDMVIEGSQGTVSQTFAKEAESEIERVIKYWTKGQEEGGKAWITKFGASPETVRAYLTLRDA